MAVSPLPHAPLPHAPLPQTPSPQPRPPRDRMALAGPGPVRRVPTPGRMARRRVVVTLSKWLLPLFALMLLGSIALWPEFTRVADQGRVAFRRTFGAAPDSARLVEPRYRGVDERGRPYTVTADVAVQTGPQRVDLTEPKGDVVLENGAWVMVQSRQGVFIQHAGQLDLSGDVTLYRDDGTVLRSETASIDLKQGAAAGDDRTHAEGPFGVLDSQGFALTDKGAVIQFQGASRLILNETPKGAAQGGVQGATPGTPPGASRAAPQGAPK